MVTEVEKYNEMRITKIENAPLNNIFAVKVIYMARKLDFSQPMNYLEVMGTTLKRCKENIDYYSQHGKRKFVF